MLDDSLTEANAGPVIWQELMESQRTAERLLHRFGFLSHAIVQAVITRFAPNLLFGSDARTRDDVARAVSSVLSSSLDRALPGPGLTAPELFEFRRAIYAVAASLAQLTEPTKKELDVLSNAANGIGDHLVRHLVRTAPAKILPRERRVRKA